MMKKLTLIYILWCMLLVSCSDGNEYMDAVPKKSPLVVSVDLMQYKGMDANTFLKTIFQIDNMANKGIDVSKKLYAFETPNGFYGLCFPVSDESALKTLLVDNGYHLSEFRGYNFSVLGNSWVIGFSDKTLLVMGPVNSNEQRNVMLNMVGYLGQSSDKGLRASILLPRLDSLQSPVALVSAMNSLPEMMRSSLMLCSPTDINMEKLYYGAAITLEDNCIQVDGTLFSHDDKDATKLSAYQDGALGTIVGKYSRYVNEKDFVTILLNTKTPLNYLTQGKADFEKLFALLNANSKSDINYKNVFNGASGEIMVGVPSQSGNPRFLISHMEKGQWQSIGKGTSDERVGYLQDGTFCIGNSSVRVAKNNKWNNGVIGKRAAMIVNLNELQRVAPLPLLANVQSVFGNRQTMLLMVR